MTHFSPTDLQRIGETTFVRHVEFHDEISSTNDRAMALAADRSVPCPALVLASRQTSGRGRGTNRWWSTDGALTFSLVLEASAADLPGKLWPRFSLIAAVAVCESLDQLLPEGRFGIKWPNDVFVDSRKLCGILVEVPPVRPEKLVLGIGLNVNNSFAEAPRELQGIATSLIDVCGREFSVAELITSLLGRLEENLLQLVASDRQLPRRWQQRCLLTGRTIEVEFGGKPVVGLCQGIGADGALHLQVDERIEKCYGGIVRRIEPPLSVPVVD